MGDGETRCCEIRMDQVGMMFKMAERASGEEEQWVVFQPKEKDKESLHPGGPFSKSKAKRFQREPGAREVQT